MALRLILNVMSILGAGLLVQACGGGVTEQVSPATTQCSAGLAAIEVGDSFFRILCGCTGPGQTAGTLYVRPAQLTCHLSKSSDLVFFHYLSATLNHQIIATGANPFTTTYSTQLKRVDVTSSFQAGLTYSFMDAYSGLTGQIIVP